MNATVKVKDLKDQIGMQGPRPFLKCFACGAEYSANKGDYWDRDPEYVFKCCGRLMHVVTQRTVYTEVAP